MKMQPIPSSMLPTPVTVTIETGQTRTGEPLETTVWTGFCRLVEKTEQRLDAERRLIALSGHIYLGEDPAPGVVLEGGTVTVEGQIWVIHKAERQRNPDGTVHHVKLLLR